MGDQRIDKGAAAATGSDADPGEGLGLAQPAAHQGGGAGDTGDLRVQGDERAAEGGEQVADGDTEGERALREATERRP